MNIIAYTYEADYHCVPCTEVRFGIDENTGYVPEDAKDGEGSSVQPVFDWEEWYANELYMGEPKATLGCSTCGETIQEVDLDG